MQSFSAVGSCQCPGIEALSSWLFLNLCLALFNKLLILLILTLIMPVGTSASVFFLPFFCLLWLSNIQAVNMSNVAVYIVRAIAGIFPHYLRGRCGVLIIWRFKLLKAEKIFRLPRTDGYEGTIFPDPTYTSYSVCGMFDSEFPSLFCWLERVHRLHFMMVELEVIPYIYKDNYKDNRLCK